MNNRHSTLHRTNPGRNPHKSKPTDLFQNRTTGPEQHWQTRAIKRGERIRVHCMTERYYPGENTLLLWCISRSAQPGRAVAFRCSPLERTNLSVSCQLSSHTSDVIRGPGKDDSPGERCAFEAPLKCSGKKQKQAMPFSRQRRQLHKTGRTQIQPGPESSLPAAVTQQKQKDWARLNPRLRRGITSFETENEQLISVI